MTKIIMFFFKLKPNILAPLPKICINLLDFYESDRNHNDDNSFKSKIIFHIRLYWIAGALQKMTYLLRNPVSIRRDLIPYL